MGRVERAVLAYLEEQEARRSGGHHPIPMAVFVQTCEAHPESVRRALRSLARRGFVTLGWENGWCLYPTGVNDEYQADFYQPFVGPNADLTVEYAATLDVADFPCRGCDGSMLACRRESRLGVAAWCCDDCYHRDPSAPPFVMWAPSDLSAEECSTLTESEAP